MHTNWKIRQPCSRTKLMCFDKKCRKASAHCMICSLSGNLESSFTWCVSVMEGEITKDIARMQTWQNSSAILTCLGYIFMILTLQVKNQLKPHRLSHAFTIKNTRKIFLKFIYLPIVNCVEWVILKRLNNLNWKLQNESFQWKWAENMIFLY